MTPSEIVKVWDFLAQTWGNKFLEEYGAKPNDAWRMTLASVEPSAAKLAINVLIRTGSPFPPTLPEFIAAAKKYRPVEERATVHELAPPPMSREQIKARLDHIRQTLNTDIDIKDMPK